MIQQSIKNIIGQEIPEVVNRANEDNSDLTITAVNINECAIDLRYTTRQYEECDGVYLKWLNSHGGWSYHLFFKAYEREVKTDDLGVVQAYYSNRASAQGDFKHLGVDAFEEWELQNYIPYESEMHRKEVESILTSRQIYLYTAAQYSGKNKWMLIRLKDGTSHKTFEKSLVYNEFAVTIQLPRINTITL